MAGVKTGTAYSEAYSTYRYYFTWNVCKQNAETGEKIINWQLISDCSGSYSRFSISLNVYNELGELVGNHGLSPWKSSFSRGETIDSGEFTCPIDTHFVAIEGYCYINGGIGLGIAQSWQLTDEYIPSPSEISCGSALIGEAPKIIIKQYDSDTSVNISYSFGNLYGTIVEGFAGTSYDGWTIPQEFYNEMLDSRYKRCTLTAVSYRNGVTTGSESCTFTVSVDTEDCTPTVSATIEDTNSTITEITKDGTKYFVKGYSNATVKVTASGSLGSSIVSYNINNDGRIATTSTATFNGITSGKFVVTVTDSRGISASTTLDVDLIDYKRISCTIEASPPTTEGETTITIRGTYFANNIGDTTNSMTLKYRRWVNGTTAPETWTTITPTKTGNAYKAEIPFSDLDYQKSYTFDVKANDLLSEATSSVIAKTNPVFSWSDSDFEFNVDTNINGKLEVDNLNVTSGAEIRNAEFNGTTTINGTLNVPANMTVEGSFSMSHVNADSITLTEDITVGGDLNVAGSTTVKALDVNGRSTFSDTAVFNGAEFNSGVTFDSSVTFDGTTTFSEAATFNDVTINGTLDYDFPFVDYVVENGSKQVFPSLTMSPTVYWGWRWRKWKSGYVECWGQMADNWRHLSYADEVIDVPFPITFENTGYHLIATVIAGKTAGNEVTQGVLVAYEGGVLGGSPRKTDSTEVTIRHLDYSSKGDAYYNVNIYINGYVG